MNPEEILRLYRDLPENMKQIAHAMLEKLSDQEEYAGAMVFLFAQDGPQMVVVPNPIMDRKTIMGFLTFGMQAANPVEAALRMTFEEMGADDEEDPS